MQNLCGLYKVYILGSPAAVVWEVPWGHWGFEHTSLFINIFTEEKMPEETIRGYLPLLPQQHVLLPARLTEVSICPFVCVCQSKNLSISSSISDFVAGEYIKSVISWLIVPIRAMRRQFISWIWLQLIAAVDDPDSLLPPGFHLFSHQAQNPG